MRTLWRLHQILDVAAALHLVQCQLLKHHLVGRVAEDLHHVDLLLDLLYEVLDLLGVVLNHDGVLVYTLYGRLRGRERLDVDVAVGEYGGYLAEKSHLVLRKYRYDKLLFHRVCGFVIRGVCRLRACRRAPSGRRSPRARPSPRGGRPWGTPSSGRWPRPARRGCRCSGRVCGCRGR